MIHFNPPFKFKLLSGTCRGLVYILQVLFYRHGLTAAGQRPSCLLLGRVCHQHSWVFRPSDASCVWGLACLWLGDFISSPHFKVVCMRRPAQAAAQLGCIWRTRWGRELLDLHGLLGHCRSLRGSYIGWIPWISHNWLFEGYLRAGEMNVLDVAPAPRMWVKLLGSLCFPTSVEPSSLRLVSHLCSLLPGLGRLSLELPVLLWWTRRLESWLPPVLQPPWHQKAIRNQSWALVTILSWLYGVYKIYLLTGTFVQRQLWL